VQVWSEYLLNYVVLYDPISKLIAKHFDVRNTFSVNQLIVGSNLALPYIHTNNSAISMTVNSLKNTMSRCHINAVQIKL